MFPTHPLVSGSRSEPESISDKLRSLGYALDSIASAYPLLAIFAPKQAEKLDVDKLILVGRVLTSLGFIAEALEDKELSQGEAEGIVELLKGVPGLSERVEKLSISELLPHVVAIVEIIKRTKG